MTWLRLDDGFDTHPKLMKLTELQRWRWTRVLLYCARHRTEGLVGREVLVDVGIGRAIPKLVSLRLLEPTPDPDEFCVNDWASFNPKDPTKAERQARWRASQRNGAVDGDVDADVDGRVDSNGVHSRVGARARPVPSKKEPRAVTPTETSARDFDEPNSPGSDSDELHPDVAAYAPDFDDVPF